MIRKNIALALRLLLKHKSITLINIIGLSFSLACTLFILLWVQHELSYDRFHPDYKNLYRVEENQYYSNQEAYHVNVTPNPSGPVWKEEIPEIVDQCRIAYAYGALLAKEEISFFEDNAAAVDSSFFSIFGFKLLNGDAASVLSEPNSMVVSEEIAKKYFGTTDVLGKNLMVNTDNPYTITGLMVDPPKNSIIRAQILFSWNYQEEGRFYSDNWGSNSIFTFVKTNGLTADSTLNRKITEVTNIHKEGNTIDFEINPIQRVHLHAYFGYGKSPGAILYVYIFAAVALFVLIIACINFMNMSTARSSLRAKEIGLRKVNGASKYSLVRQHLAESVLQSFISIIIALIIIIALLPKFNELSGKDLTISSLFSLRYLLGILAVGLFTGFLAGLYPAFYLSGINPAKAMKENTDNRKGSGLLRKILVVFQFSLSVLLIAGAFIVNRQLNYMRTADLGFNKEHLITIPMMGGLNSHYTTLKTEFLKDPSIDYVSASMHQPYNIGSNSSSIDWPGKDENEDILVSFTGADFDFTSALGIKFEAGRGFSEEFQGDMYHDDSLANFIINQTLARIMDQEEIVGTNISFQGLQGQVVGVMEDFNFLSLKDAVEPLAITPLPQDFLSVMIVRLKGEDIQKALASMEDTWKSVVPQFPFEYKFVDEEIDNMYRTEERMSVLIKLFTIVALLIAAMGLFALASFTAERRTREIGIRKTYGADDSQIVRLLLGDILKLVVYSLIIALPAVWLLARRWLADFHFRIDVTADIFIISGLVALLVSTLTVIYHALKGARMNPVEALHYE